MVKSPCCSKEGLKRGAWTATEDRILKTFIEAHGEGKWRSLPQRAGLKRCGKSCRLRWLNYLRPDIKRGNISRDEEELIIRLHNLLGNRWSLIAGRLPGRTDNEIKNYWNTTLAKKAKARSSSSSTTASPPLQERKRETGSCVGNSATDRPKLLQTPGAPRVPATRPRAIRAKTKMYQEVINISSMLESTEKSDQTEVSTGSRTNNDCCYHQVDCINIGSGDHRQDYREKSTTELNGFEEAESECYDVLSDLGCRVDDKFHSWGLEEPLFFHNWRDFDGEDMELDSWTSLCVSDGWTCK